jgi:carboxylesterase
MDKLVHDPVLKGQPSWDEVLGPSGFLEQRGPVGVLLIHGLTGTPTEMKHFGRQLAKKGFSVACPQLAGHCTSIGALKATHWHDWYRSVEQAFERMSQTYEKVFVGGLSMGALLALLLAANKGKRVSGVFLLSTTFFYDGWNVPKLKRKFLLPLVLHTPLKHFMYWKETAPYGIKCERTRARVETILTQKSARTADKIGYFKTPATVILESTHLIKAARDCLVKVITPTLIVHSTEDDIASVKSAHYVSSKIAAPHVETYFVNDTYHVLTLDKRKDDIARRVGTFCRSLSVAE